MPVGAQQWAGRTILSTESPSAGAPKRRRVLPGSPQKSSSQRSTGGLCLRRPLAPADRGKDPDPIAVRQHVVERAGPPVHEHKPHHVDRYSESVEESSRCRPRRGGYRLRLPHLEVGRVPPEIRVQADVNRDHRRRGERSTSGREGSCRWGTALSDLQGGPDGQGVHTGRSQTGSCPAPPQGCPFVLSQRRSCPQPAPEQRQPTRRSVLARERTGAAARKGAPRPLPSR